MMIRISRANVLQHSLGTIIIIIISQSRSIGLRSTVAITDFDIGKTKYRRVVCVLKNEEVRVLACSKHCSTE